MLCSRTLELGWSWFRQGLKVIPRHRRCWDHEGQGEMWEEGGAEAGKRKKKIRGDEQAGVLIALKLKKRKQTVLLAGLSKQPSPHVNTLHRGALRPLQQRGATNP